MKKLLALFACSFLCLGSATSGEVTSGNPYTSGKNFYSEASRLDCGETTLIISKTCMADSNDAADTNCLLQTASFMIGDKLIVNHYYPHLPSPDPNATPFIYTANCLKTKDHFYFELASANLGNCGTCEWSDYFSERGLYIGSLKGRPARTSFKKKLISPNHAVLHATPVKRIDMTTIQTEKP